MFCVRALTFLLSSSGRIALIKTGVFRQQRCCSSINEITFFLDIKVNIFFWCRIIAYFYSAKPFKFSSRGLGDVLVYIAMGFLMTWGAFYVQIHQWSWYAFAASVPVGFLVTAILNMNNVRDYQDDLAVDKKTLPVRFGQRFGQRFHAFLLFGSYVAVTLFALVGLLPWLSLLVWMTFPLAFTNVRSVLRASDRSAFILGIKRTAAFHLQFGVVFAVALVVAMVLKV